MRCLAIGISDAEPLGYLGGAIQAAEAFGAWTRGLLIPTVVLEDGTNPVSVSDVAAALTSLLPDKGGVTRFFLYFAGHGLSRGAAEDLWLLTKWNAEQRAISVNGLRRRLERYGLSQLTVIGDACRTATAADDAVDLTADHVLGRGPFAASPPRTDLFRPAAALRAAYTAPGVTIDEDRCIFSGVLLDALSGGLEGAFDPARGCITSASLANYLEDAVPRRAGLYGVALRPDIETGFRTPDDVYLPTKPDSPPPLPPWPEPKPQAWRDRRAPDERSGIGGIAARDDPAGLGDRSGGRSTFGSRDALGRPAERTGVSYIASIRDVSTTTGFDFLGAIVTTVILGGAAHSSKGTGQGEWGMIPSPPAPPDVPIAAPTSILVRTDGGLWGGAAVLPGFVGSLSFDERGAFGLVFRHGHDPDAPAPARRIVDMLQGDGLDAQPPIQLAAKLRADGASDPLCALIAGYLYDRQGDFDGVRRTAYHLAAAGVPLPFDLAMLVRAPVHESTGARLDIEIPATLKSSPRCVEEERIPSTYEATPAATGIVAGSFPWLRQGWAMIDEAEWPTLPSELWALRSRLVPAVFTTFDDDAGASLARMLETLR